MPPVTVSSWIDDATTILFNPSAIQRLSLQRLRDIKDGNIDVPDATSPFAFVLENSAINTAAFLEANELSTRRQYASVAQNPDDLYLHMSDKDFIDRFATPASANFYVMIEKRALERAMVYDPVTDISTVIIPRNTEFKVEDFIFSIQYPIEIKKLSHGGYQVTYDNSIESPLQILTTNIVEKSFVTPQKDTTFLQLKIPTQQFWIKSVKSTLTTAKLFKKTVSFTDSFYYARVFYKNSASNNKWVEIKTTHTDQVYDPLVVTAVLKVNPNTVDVFIPQIYFSSNSISGDVRIDVYQTKGAVNLSLSNYSVGSFSASWKAIDDTEVTEEVANFQAISEIVIFSPDTINNGTLSLSFEELRRRVINNSAGARNLPITNIQIEDSLTSNGFTIVKDVDVVTNRTFLATRELIKPFDERLITSAATSMQSTVVTMREVAKHPAVFDNGNRITLSPDVMYRLDNGQMNIVSAGRVTSIVNSSSEDAALMVNSEQYVYSPFHYVLDATDSQFRLRPYYMDAPSAIIRQFVDHNASTTLEANTELYSLIKTSFGYRLTVQVKGNDIYNTLTDDQIFAQLYYIPKSEVSKAYLNGQLLGRTTSGGALFAFDFNTKFDINDQHSLFLNSFTMENLLNQSVASELLQDFNVVYGCFDKLSINWTIHEIDAHIGQFMLPRHGYAITEESFRLQFGQWLKNLWAGCRSFPAPQQYSRYIVDIPASYPEDVYNVDPVTLAIFSLDASNNVVYSFKHHKGDNIINADGSPVFEHKAGDIIYGSNGSPIAVSELEVARQIDLFVVEGAYYFATDTSSSTYKTSFVSAVVDWTVNDIERLSQQVLEETFIYFYPKTNMGTLRVIGENGFPAYLPASQSFNVRLFVRDQVMRNADLRNKLTESCIKAIDNELKKSVIAISNIENAIQIIAGSDVFAIEVKGLGGSSNFQAVSTISVGDRFSIRKRLTAQSDGKLIVEEDVSVEFIQHAIKQ
jgi:hypothetical protein